jgi:hypothetical protein
MPHDTTAPIFNRITTSSKTFSIDCVPTSVTVTARITSPSGIKRVVLYSRVGTDQAYTPTGMEGTRDEYRATVNAVDMLGKGYGIWEFYITAEDLAGQQSKSSLDQSVEMLMCVSS